MTKKADHRVQRITSSLVSPFVDAWIATLLLGGAHSMDARVPALGYLTTLALVYIFICASGTGAFAAILTDQSRK